MKIFGTSPHGSPDSGYSKRKHAGPVFKKPRSEQTHRDSKMLCFISVQAKHPAALKVWCYAGQGAVGGGMRRGPGKMQKMPQNRDQQTTPHSSQAVHLFKRTKAEGRHHLLWVRKISHTQQKVRIFRDGLLKIWASLKVRISPPTFTCHVSRECVR